MAGAPTIASIFAHRIVVGVGDMAVSNLTLVTLSTYALGSCIGVVAYDSTVKAGGILHLMLSDSRISPDKAVTQPAMFADTGLPLFFRALAGLRAERRNLRILLAGGASVLQGSDPFKIGERNIQAVRAYLEANGYHVSGTDLGGSTNRTLHLEVATGKVALKTPGGTDQLSLAA
jgi:chemotaxis protein CheD